MEESAVEEPEGGGQSRPRLTGWMIVTIVGIVAVAAVAATALVTHSTTSSVTTTSTTRSTGSSSTTHAATTAGPSTTIQPAPTTTQSSPTTTVAPLPILTAGGWTGRQPTTIDFSGGCCNVVDHITWSSWNSAQAVGQGTWEYDTCASGCVNGPFDPYPATITLSGPLGGTVTALTDATTGPEGSVTNWVYPQPWPFSAS